MPREIDRIATDRAVPRQHRIDRSGR